MIRLDKYLSDSTSYTRSEIKKHIKSGLVSVNDRIIKDGSVKIEPEKDIIKYKGDVLLYSKFLYIMLNKPSGVISAAKDISDKTVLDILPEKYKNRGLFPVGRLDKDTVGLLLLTNDGDFAHNTLSPKKHIQKTYIAEYSGILPENAEELFENGIELRDFKCKSASLKRIGENTAEVIISEGKFHQVKRMFVSLGCKVTNLKRTAFGDIKLDKNLSEGECRELNDEEMEYVSSFCGK